ncbi:hypothetical protein HOD75_01595 [archaeon]|jgi:hypothetical protein|nr:hypothetical protein [archaeon]MBT4241572.1 hypothetical protein [archaeon]MBT4417967.1 hypothetical protein [archaeon]
MKEKQQNPQERKQRKSRNSEDKNKEKPNNNSKKTNRSENTITTIKLSKETKERLERFKEHPKETYDEVLKKMLYILNHCRKDPEKSQKILSGIDKRTHARKEYDSDNE